jgi:hypothetical protein
MFLVLYMHNLTRWRVDIGFAGSAQELGSCMSRLTHNTSLTWIHLVNFLIVLKRYATSSLAGLKVPHVKAPGRENSYVMGIVSSWIVQGHEPVLYIYKEKTDRLHMCAQLPLYQPRPRIPGAVCFPHHGICSCVVVADARADILTPSLVNWDAYRHNSWGTFPSSRKLIIFIHTPWREMKKLEEIMVCVCVVCVWGNLSMTMVYRWSLILPWLGSQSVAKSHGRFA